VPRVVPPIRPSAALIAALVIVPGVAAAQQLTVRARDVSPPVAATPAPSWGAPPSGGGAWGQQAPRGAAAAGGAWSAWPKESAWRGGQGTRAPGFTGDGQVARVGGVFPAGAVPFTTGGGVAVAPAPGRGVAWFPPRLVSLLLPTCDAWGNCWRQPTQVTAVWHAGWQRYVWVDGAGRVWPL
jgi:hypothetical protein